MENAKKSVELTEDELEAFSRLVLPEPQTGECIYNHFAITGIRVDRVEPGFVVCTLKDRAGNLAIGAIANLVDLVGASVHFRGLPHERFGGRFHLVSVKGEAWLARFSSLAMSCARDMQRLIALDLKLQDELEITSKSLGQRGRYSGVLVLIRNKATGEMIAEGRHSLFRSAASKL